MPFKRVPQTFTASINSVTIGTGDKALTLGGENVMPLYTFDAPIENRPLIGVEVNDLGVDEKLPKLVEFYAGADTVVDQAKRAMEIPGADFLVLTLGSSDPNGEDNSIENCVETCKQVADAVDVPIAIQGCGGIEKNAKMFEKISEALQGRNVLLMSAREENYKAIGAAAGLAYDQKVSAESAVDINLAKQLNVLITQLGVKPESMVMNLGSAASGYGFEYVASTMDRVKSAALAQNDQMLQMPVVTPVSDEAWNVKESIVSEEDFPEWGPVEERGIQMEISTAAACLASGSNAVILRHPDSIATISALIADLM
ncbi:MAG: acetyl-CoA decarbonylase/synthase complex subunit delta [Coriobacteriales bacterium]|jgi:acetyl-CoA decarbonylase/synthase complex subunit delta